VRAEKQHDHVPDGAVVVNHQHGSHGGVVAKDGQLSNASAVVTNGAQATRLALIGGKSLSRVVLLVCPQG
jgi:hypothetical protein